MKEPDSVKIARLEEKVASLQEAFYVYRENIKEYRALKVNVVVTTLLALASFIIALLTLLK